MDHKTFQELVFKAENRKRSGQLIASRSYWLTEICFSPRWSYSFWGNDAIYEWSQHIEQRYRINIFFRNVSLVCFTAELDE